MLGTWTIDFWNHIKFNISSCECVCSAQQMIRLCIVLNSDSQINSKF